MIDFGVRVVTVILGKRRINVERQRGKKKKNLQRVVTGGR